MLTSGHQHQHQHQQERCIIKVVATQPFDDQFDVGVDNCRYIYIYLFPIPIHPLPGDDQESVPGAAAGGWPGPGGEVATLFTLK